ncbi:hypothetical protein CFC21_027552 [Triticum aestivum]|uniref:DUF4220 domain-containing protein n=2 Tax=Triticum aestivum TaxID=4565 RepID=A0A9R1ENY4_WHEAT|nr:hypothetical protein CFC21_027552 [Triticum aestivum]
MDLKNTTTNTTLVQRLGSNEVRLLRVELLVLFSTLAWILLERFGSFRRRYSHGFFRLLIWTVYTLSTVLAPYTVGLLQAGPFRDQTFVLWGTILLLIQVHSDSLSVYSIQDIEQRKKMLAQQALQIFLVLWLIINGSGGNKSYRATIWIVYILSIIQAFRKFRHLSKASKKGGLVERSKVIADHMRVELKEVTSVKYITIDSVWRWIESGGFEHKETAEGSVKLALEDTASRSGDEGSYVGTFQVIEEELSFLFGIVWKLCLEVPNDTPTNPQTKTETWSPTAGETWERKLGQYSLLLNFDYDPWNALSFLSLGLIEATRKGQKAGEKIKLADTVIVHVLSQFKNNNGKVENGQSATNQLGSQFSWACTLPTHIHTILVWHIATTISWNEVPLEGNLDRLVAVSLSDYCAYLVAFVPDMLPGHGHDTRCTFDAVVLEAQQCLAECETVSNRCEKLVRGLGGMGGTGTILYMGAKLGRQLRDMVPDQEQRWKVLADFWAEFILFLAPSDNTEIHGEKLSAGGEFMTHLWALLTHAGILERPSSSSGRD